MLSCLEEWIMFEILKEDYNEKVLAQYKEELLEFDDLE